MELIMARKTEEGAKTIVWAALAGHDNAAVRESLRGAYTSECTVVEASDAAISQDGQVVEKKIWVRLLSFFRLCI
jgi:retinol dehydrogenase-12